LGKNATTCKRCQAEENCAASDLPMLPAETMAAVAGFCDEKIPLVDQRW
jgi:hypothetical protein